MRTVPASPFTTFGAGSPLPYSGEAYVSNGCSFLLSPPRAQVAFTVGIPNWGSPLTPIAYDALVVDTDGFTTGTTGFTGFAVPYAGTYEINLVANYNGNIAQVIFLTLFRLSAGVTTTLIETASSAADDLVSSYYYVGGSATCTAVLAAGDFISAQIAVSSPGHTNYLTPGADRNAFSIRMVATS